MKVSSLQSRVLWSSVFSQFPLAKKLWSYGKEFVREETKILLEIGQRAQRDR